MFVVVVAILTIFVLLVLGIRTFYFTTRKLHY